MTETVVVCRMHSDLEAPCRGTTFQILSHPDEGWVAVCAECGNWQGQVSIEAVELP